MVKCKPKTINAINRLRPLAISDTITNMFEQILLHHIDVNKKTIKKTTKTKTLNNQFNNKLYQIVSLLYASSILEILEIKWYE